MWQLVTAMIIWGTIGLFAVKSTLAPADIAFYRCLIGALLLLPYCIYQGYFKNVSIPLKLLLLMSAGSFCVVGNWILLYLSFQYTSITLSNLCYYIQPIFLLLISYLFFHEKISAIQWIMMCITTLGIIISTNSNTLNHHYERHEIIGISCALFAGFLYSIAILIAKHVHNIPSTMFRMMQLLIGSILLFPFIHKISITTSIVSSILILGVVHTVIAFLLYYQSVKLLPITTIAVASYIDPIVAILTDVIFFNHKLYAIQLFGIALTFIGSFFVISAKTYSREVN